MKAGPPGSRCARQGSAARARRRSHELQRSPAARAVGAHHGRRVVDRHLFRLLAPPLCASVPCPRPRRRPEHLSAAPWPHEAPATRLDRCLCKLRPTKPRLVRRARPRRIAGRSGALAAQDLTAVRSGLTRTSATFSRPAPLRAYQRTCVSARFRRAASRTLSKQRPPLSRRWPTRPKNIMAELGWRDFAAALLYAHPDLATRPLRARVRALSLARRRDRFSRLGAWRDRLSDRRRRHAPTVAHGIPPQSRTHDRGVLSRQAFAHRLAPWRGNGSGTRSSTPIRRAIHSTGSGSQAQASNPRPISASSIRCCRPKSSTPTASMCGAGSPSSRGLRRRPFIVLGRLRATRLRAQGSC